MRTFRTTAGKAQPTRGRPSGRLLAGTAAAVVAAATLVPMTAAARSTPAAPVAAQVPAAAAAETATDRAYLFVKGKKQGVFRGDGVSAGRDALVLLGFTDIETRPSGTGKITEQFSVRRRASGFAPQFTLALRTAEQLDLRLQVMTTDSTGLTSQLQQIKVTAAVVTRVRRAFDVDGALIEEITFGVDPNRITREGYGGIGG
jgi:hypothetical protein